MKSSNYNSYQSKLNVGFAIDPSTQYQIAFTRLTKRHEAGDAVAEGIRRGADAVSRMNATWHKLPQIRVTSALPPLYPL